MLVSSVYAFRALDSIRNVTWEDSDRRLSDAMTTYWANFAHTGDPNGSGPQKWPRCDAGGGLLLHLDETIRDGVDSNRARYVALDAQRGCA